MGVRSPGYLPRVTWSTLEGKPTVFPPAAHTHGWADITGKPASFPPAAHTHAYGDLTGIPATFAPAAHTHAWVDVTGKPTSFPPAAHTHSYNDLTDKPSIPTAGRLQFIADVPFSETLLLSLSLGMKRRVVAVAGVLATDRLVFAPTAIPTAGCEVINVQPSGAGNVSVGYYTPLLGLGATYSLPFALYRITT